MSSGGGTLLRGSSGGGGGAGGAGGGSSSKASANANGASGAADGVLSITPDSPADSEWRSRRGPLDASEGGSGPWGEEDAAGMLAHVPQTHEYHTARPGERAVGLWSCRVFFFFPSNGVAQFFVGVIVELFFSCLLYTSPSPRDATLSRMPSSA